MSDAVVSFKYDAFGRRVEKVSSSTTSIYIYDGDNLIEETNAVGTAVARYTQGLNIDEPLAMLRGTTTSYYSADGLGSITSLTNSSGANAATYTYDAFGNLTASTGSLTNSFRYTSREFDTETNLYFYRARYYDPNAGRFIAEDSVDFHGGIDFYIYARNNPLRFVDPFGTCIITVLFEPPAADPGIFQHAFLILSDNTTPGSRPWEFRAGPDDWGNNTLGANLAQYGVGRLPPPDDPNGASAGVNLLNDNCSCTPYLNKLSVIDQFLRPGRIPYKRFGPNSNTAVTTAIDFMGLPRPKLPFAPWRVPGWGDPLPGWPPGAGNAKK